jgi:hypothetical protein
MRCKDLLSGVGLVASLSLSSVGCDRVKDAVDEAMGSEDDSGEAKSKKKKKKGAKKRKATHRMPGKNGVMPDPPPGMTIQPRVGAWVKYATRPKAEPPGTLTWSVVERPEPTNYMIELEMAQGPQRFLTRADAIIVDLRDPDGNDFKSFQFKVPGQAAVRLPGMLKSQIEESVASLFRIANPTRIEGAPQETVKVKAGTFEGCYKIRGPGVAFGVKQTATHWVHPSVPLPGIVKSVAAAGEMELDSYALSGAKSEF